MYAFLPFLGHNPLSGRPLLFTCTAPFSFRFLKLNTTQETPLTATLLLSLEAVLFFHVDAFPPHFAYHFETLGCEGFSSPPILVLPVSHGVRYTSFFGYRPPGLIANTASTFCSTRPPSQPKSWQRSIPSCNPFETPSVLSPLSRSLFSNEGVSNDINNRYRPFRLNPLVFLHRFLSVVS